MAPTQGASLCPSCGGIVGRECFNTSECQWITESMAHTARRRQEAAMREEDAAEANAEILALRGEVERLRVENARLYRKAYISIKLPRGLRWLANGTAREGA